MKMGKKILAALMVLVMVMGLMPVTVSAGGGGYWYNWEELAPGITYEIVDGVLTIYGEGDMGTGETMWTSEDPAWREHKDDVKKIVISEGITRISAFAFYSFGETESVTIPSSVKSIGEYAFEWCDSLTSVTIPPNVSTIENYAFEWCKSLTSITIPSSVTSIGGGVFAGCTSLTTIEVDGDNHAYYSVDGVLFNKRMTELVAYPAGGAISYEIPTSVTHIGQGAFRGCTELASVTIPASVKSIGTEAFSLCSSLTSVTIPSSVTYIGYDSFYTCESLSSVTIEEGVPAIDNSAFEYSFSLTTVTIPQSVTSIQAHFESLTDVFYGGSEEQWNAIDIPEYRMGSFENATIHYNSPMPEPSAPIVQPEENEQQDYDSGDVPSQSFMEQAEYWFHLVNEIVGEPTPASTVAAEYADMSFMVNGDTVLLEVYNIDGNNYFKLRDLAMLVSETEKQFNVVWYEEMREIWLYPNMGYEPVGGELAQGNGADKQGNLNTSPLVLHMGYDEMGYGNAMDLPLNAYTINGNNYFKLRDLCKLFDIGVTWDEATWTVGIDTSVGYTD